MENTKVKNGLGMFIVFAVVVIAAIVYAYQDLLF